MTPSDVMPRNSASAAIAPKASARGSSKFATIKTMIHASANTTTQQATQLNENRLRVASACCVASSGKAYSTAATISGASLVTGIVDTKV